MKFKKISVDYLVVHCAATRPSMDIGAAEITDWHRKENSFLTIGYHFVIRRDGTLEEGRPVTRQGAHARGFNHRSLGICLVGGVTEEDHKTPEDNFTVEQKAVLKALLHRLKSDYPDAEILGHRDLPRVKKSCPSFDVRSWWEEVNS